MTLATPSWSAAVFGPTFNPEVRIGDVISSIALLVAAGSLIFAGYQVLQNHRASRHQFLFNTIDRYFRDPETRSFYYELDYHRWKFDPRTLPMSREEPHLDHLIYTFDLIEQMVQKQVLKESEIAILGFQALRVIDNPEVQKYLAWLDDEYRMVGRPVPAHSGARKLAERFREVNK